MGISNISMPKVGDVICGKLGTYILKNVLGHGGNGTVFDIRIVEQKSALLNDETEYVAKILTIGAIKSQENGLKRQERFRQEVSIVQSINDTRLAVIPIIDSFLYVDNAEFEWYVMPKAKEYRFFGYSQPLFRLKQLRKLGDTLIQLHQKGICHRDIKPANLLYYNNMCCLTDFGLAWNVEQDAHITNENEAIGPIAIRPPEMDYHAEKLRQELDYQKVDVYLFVKTIWIILTGNHNGFRGEYRRSDLMIYLDKKRLNLGQTIEPLHRMLESATLHSNMDRITLSECLQLIDQQIDIAEGRIEQNVLESLLYDESISEARHQIASDATILDTPQKMQIAISKMEKAVEVCVNDFGEKISLGILNRIEMIDENTFALSIKNKYAIGGICRNRKIFMRIKQIIIRDDNSNEIRTEKFKIPINVKEIAHGINELNNVLESEVGLDGEYLLSLNKINN